MRRYIIKRILYVLLVALILSLLMYLIYNLIPYDRAATQARADLNANKGKGLSYEELYAEYQVLYGLDGNIFVRYLRWVGIYPNSGTGKFNGLLQGNFGYSHQYGEEVINLIKIPLGNTALLNIFATVLALAVTIPLGIKTAVKKGSLFDQGTQVFTIIGYSIPVFITAILFIYFFAVILGLFPVSGMGTPGAEYTGFRLLIDKIYYMALPLIVMTFASLGGMTRYVRASMIEALSMDCIRTARSKGIKEKVVIYSHAWRNALIPVVTLVIGWFLGIFSGSIMIENIFGYNGIGRMYIGALSNNDFEVVLCLQMFYVTISLFGNLVIDLIYGFVDPRIRVSA